MGDLQTRADVATIVDNFYAKATQDKQIGFFFEGLDLLNHLPVIHDFWENILWRTGAYQGGMMYKHLRLNAQKTLQPEHFERWLELFTQTVDAHFSGPNAEAMKQTARSVARTMLARVLQPNLLATLDAPRQGR